MMIREERADKYKRYREEEDRRGVPACCLLFVATLLRITLITDPFSLQSVLVTMHCNAEYSSAPSAAHIQSILPLKPCFFGN